LKVRDENNAESTEIIIESLGAIIDNEIRNASGSFRTRSNEVIRAFLTQNDEFVHQAFLHSQKHAAAHSARNNHEKLVQFLAEFLPTVDCALAGATFNVWMTAQKGALFQSAELPLHVLQAISNELPIEILANYVNNVCRYKLDSDAVNELSECVVRLLTGHLPVDLLQENRILADLVREPVLNFLIGNDDQIPYFSAILGWLRPLAVPEKLVEYVNNSVSSYRSDLFDAFVFVRNFDTFDYVRNCENLSLREMKVLYSLMSKYEPHLLVEQPPLLIEKHGRELVCVDGLSLMKHLVVVASEFRPEWLCDSSPVFESLLRLVDFNDDSADVRGLSADVLSLFVDSSKTVHDVKDNALIVKCASAVPLSRLDPLLTPV
jgi:hypothetical protein